MNAKNNKFAIGRIVDGLYERAERERRMSRKMLYHLVIGLYAVAFISTVFSHVPITKVFPIAVQEKVDQTEGFFYKKLLSASVFTDRINTLNNHLLDLYKKDFADDKADYKLQIEQINSELAKAINQYRMLIEETSGYDNEALLEFYRNQAPFPYVSTVILMSGLALLFYLIQIAVSFIRYHTKIAQLYEAQADALVSAEGDLDKACLYLESFSPACIDFGKMPETIHTKMAGLLSKD